MLVLNNVSSGYSTNVINNNFASIANYINQSLLNRDGLAQGEPNQMENALDMNSQDILNVGRMGAKEINLDGIPVKQLLDNTVEEAAQEADRAKREADRAEQEADRAEAATIAHDAYLLNRTNHTGVQPISTVSGLQSALDSKVNVVAGKQLSTEDFTTPLKTKLDGIAEGATVNQTDAFLLNRVNHTGAQAISTVTGLQTALDTKVDKAAGKQLSTEDYTSAEKTKLSGIATGATANNTDSFLLDRANHTGTQPASTITGLEAVATSGAAVDVSISDAGNYFTGANVEVALQEVGAMIGGIGSALDLINGEVV